MVFARVGRAECRLPRDTRDRPRRWPGRWWPTDERCGYGLSLQKLGRDAEAVASYDRALTLQPSNADNHHNRGNALYSASRYGEAAAAFTTAVTLQPRDGESYFNLGNSYDKLGQTKAAGEAFATTLALDPTDASAAYNLANALKADGKLDEAVHWYKGALQADPSDGAKHANLAFALDSSGRFVEAEAAFGRAVTLDPNDASSYTGLGHACKAQGSAADLERAVSAYEAALTVEPSSAAAYAGLAYALKEVDPAKAAAAFASFAKAEEASGAASAMGKEARRFATWLDADQKPPQCSAREWAAVQQAAVYPDAFEHSARRSECSRMTYAEAVAMGPEALLARGPTLLTNATVGWRLRELTDAELVAEVGTAPFRMLVMPDDVHPTLDLEHAALVEPATSGVFFADYLRLLDRLSETEEFAVYVAQLNLLRLPKLLEQVCLPKALPGAKMSMANFWVGGRSMKNGLHFDNFDNLLHQLHGSKRALVLPPSDTPHLYYTESGANIRRHSFTFDADGRSAAFANETTHEQVRQNVAMINVFEEAVGTTHPKIAEASPLICELSEGEALFMPKGWHHAVISTAEGARNVAVNTWYDLQGTGRGGAVEKASSLADMFQTEGCE